MSDANTLAFKAAMTQDQVLGYEKRIQFNNSIDRLTLSVLAMDGDALFEGFNASEKDRASLLGLIDLIEGRRDLLNAEIARCSTVIARLTAVSVAIEKAPIKKSGAA